MCVKTINNFHFETEGVAYWQGLTTGGLPNFVDVGNSFGSFVIVEDNFINE